MQKSDQQYLEEKNRSESPEDLIGRFLFKLIGLQDLGNSGIRQIILEERQRFTHLNTTQARFVNHMVRNIKQSIEEKQFDFSDITEGIGQLLEGLESSNLELRGQFRTILSQHPQIGAELAKIGELLQQQAAGGQNLDKVAQMQKEGFVKLGEMIALFAKEVRNRESKKELQPPKEIKLAKPSWWGSLEISWEPLKELFEKLKKHTFLVKVENQFKLDENFLRSLPEEVAQKISKVLEESLPKIRIRGGGAGVNTSIIETNTADIADKISDTKDEFKLADWDDAADPSYWSFIDKDGNYYFEKYDETNRVRKFWKPTADNPVYATDWGNRAAKTYGYFDAIF